MTTRAVGVMTWFALAAACDDDPGRSALVAGDIRGNATVDAMPGDVTIGSDATTAPDVTVDADPEVGPDVATDTDPDPDPDTSREEDDIDGDATTPPECTHDDDCADRAAGVCTTWRCGAGGSCEEAPRGDGSACRLAGQDGRCAGTSCTFACGDGIVQAGRGETCDDGDSGSGDGCRGDCVREEPIGAGWSGGQCETDGDCGPLGSVCVLGVGGGSCAVACTSICADEPGAPVTFCIDADVYESRMDTALPAELGDALCVAKCDFDQFPRTGCRDGLHCELHTRHAQVAQDEVCVPGPWSIGLSLSADGADVLGRDLAAPAPAEPYATLVQATCGGAFGAVDAQLFRGLADTLLAMGPDGRARTWERLCTPPAGLPTWHGLHAEAGRAYRLTGTRLEVVDWSAAALYGGIGARGFRVGGPLYASRVMVYRAGAAHWLYADGADDRPHADPEAGRHFASIEGEEWAPLESELEPDIEYAVIKASGGGRFHRQWGPLATIDYLAAMALDHLIDHGVLLGIGDVSLPTGGDIDDHSSHEVGLDVDLYLLTFPADPVGDPDVTRPNLWVSRCDQDGGVWECWYIDNATGALEDEDAPLHVPAATQLASLAAYTRAHAGPSWFVHHDVLTLAPFRALGGSSPRFVDATNDAATGWPAHYSHVHVRFLAW